MVDHSRLMVGIAQLLSECNGMNRAKQLAKDRADIKG